jgi:predicted P-loop ATPase
MSSPSASCPRKPSPLGHKAGAEWTQDDDVRLGLWFAEQDGLHQLVIRSTDTIRAAVQHVAKLGVFHPVREFLELIEWDGQARVDEWACVISAPSTRRTTAWWAASS